MVKEAEGDNEITLSVDNVTENDLGWKKWLTWAQWQKNVFTMSMLSITLAVAFTVISGVGNNVLFYKISIPYQNYPFFLSLYSAAMGVPIYWLFVLAIVLVPKLKHYITKEQLAFPIWKFAVLGLLDSLQGTMQFLADSHVNGAMQQLLGQAVVPLTMASSVLFLKTRFTLGQYTGALIIIIGIIFDIVPMFFNSSQSTSNLPNQSVGESIFWISIFLLSTIPFAISYLYKEVMFKAANINIFYLMAMDSDFQFLCTILLTPLNAVPYLGSASSFSDVYLNIFQGAMCFFGVNSNPGDQCEGTWYLLVEYFFFNIAINLLMLYLVAYASSTFMFLAMTLTVPLANICFSFKIIMGVNAVPLSWVDITALVLIVFGLVLYRFTAKDEKIHTKDVEPEEDTLLVNDQ